MVWASLFTASSLFLKHVLIFSTRMFPYCINVATTYCEYHNTSTLSMNVCNAVVEMFSYVLRQRSSNTLETFLEYVAATSCANVFTTFPQRMTLRQHHVGTFSQLLLNI